MSDGRLVRAETALGIAVVDVDADELVELEAGDPLPRMPLDGLGLPLLVAADALGSRVVAVVDRRPPLAVSDDGGLTWREAGGGLPRGQAVAIADDHPDLLAYAAGSRLYVSEDGGRFWRSLVTELPEIVAVAWGGQR